MGSRWRIRRFRTGPQSEPRGHVSSTRAPVAGVALASEGIRGLPPVGPALGSGAEDSRAAERQCPSGRGPRAREHRLQARLAQQPTPTVPTVVACARRAFRGTRVVARRNALSRSSSSTTPSGPARPLRLASVPRPGMTNTDVRLGTHPGARTGRGSITDRPLHRPFRYVTVWHGRVALTNAERQARCREWRKASESRVRYRRPADRRSRPQRRTASGRTPCRYRLPGPPPWSCSSRSVDTWRLLSCPGASGVTADAPANTLPPENAVK